MMIDESGISISINEVIHPVLCGTCKTPVAFIGKTDGETGDTGCVSCGNLADLHEVAQIAIEYAKDEGRMMINRMTQSVVGERKFMTFTGKATHNKAYRFIVDLQR